MTNVKRILHVADPWLKFLILAGAFIYFIEVASCISAADERRSFFWWMHGFISMCFTMEYILRWVDDGHDNYGWHYPHSAIGVVDFIAIAPFWISFFLPIDWLQIIRTLRVFQLLKFFRYSRSLLLVALGFYRAAPSLRPLCFSMSVISLFCSVAIFEIEHDAQPDKFRNIFDAIYFTMVTVATVGYVDLSPITILGRITVMLSFVTGLAVFAGILGVVGASFFKVMQEEIDPTIDPLEEFQKERERQLVRWPAKETLVAKSEKQELPELPK
jgi:voltage-gated potassium channel